MPEPTGWTLVQPAKAPTSAPGWTMVAPAEARSESDASSPDWMSRLAEWLPAVGGTVGGVAGTVAGPIGSVGGAALGGMAGEAYKELINRARGRQAPGSMAEAATTIGTQGAVQGGAQAVGQFVVAPAMTALGQRVMQSAVKPAMKLLIKSGGQTPPVVSTLLREGINVTPGGVSKLTALLDANQDDIAAALAPVAQKEIPAVPIAGRLTETARKFANQVNPQADLDAISQVGENFLDSPAVSAAGRLTIAKAQAVKSGTYKQIGGKYGQLSSAAIEAEKALARGLKDAIAKEAPDISALNAREGQLLEALSAVGKRVALAGNRDPVGFAWVAHNPTTFLAALFDRSPAVKSLVARGLYSTAAKFGQVSPALIRTAVHALAAEDAEGAMAASSTNRSDR